MFFKRTLITITIVVIVVWVNPANAAASKGTEDLRSHCENFLTTYAGFKNDNTAINNVNEYENNIENNLSTQANYNILRNKLAAMKESTGGIYINLSSGPKMRKAVSYIAKDFAEYLQSEEYKLSYNPNNNGENLPNEYIDPDNSPVTYFVNATIYDGHHDYVKEMFAATLQ